MFAVYVRALLFNCTIVNPAKFYLWAKILQDA